MVSTKIETLNSQMEALHNKCDDFDKQIENIMALRLEVINEMNTINNQLYVLVDFRKSYDINHRINLISHFSNSPFSNDNYKSFCQFVKAKEHRHKRERFYPYIFHKSLTKKEWQEKDNCYWELVNERQEKKIYLSLEMNKEMEIQYENHEKEFLTKNPKYARLIQKENNHYNMVMEYKKAKKN